MSEFPKWIPHSEYSFLLDSSPTTGQEILKELPSTVIVRVSKKQVNSQLQRFLTIEEEMDLHLILMFKWPVRADTAAKALNDFWLVSSSSNQQNGNQKQQICPIPQKNTRLNQNGVSLYSFVQEELLGSVLKDHNKNNNKSGPVAAASSFLLKQRQAEREPDFETMQKWTMLDFYAAKKRQVF